MRFPIIVHRDANFDCCNQAFALTTGSAAALQDTGSAHDHKRPECHYNETHETKVGAVTGPLHPAGEWIIGLGPHHEPLNRRWTKYAADTQGGNGKTHGNPNDSSQHALKCTL